jgi:hypothetical protein
MRLSGVLAPHRLGSGRLIVPRKRTYSTTFDANETPLSESGSWTSVQDRTLFNSSGGVAFGTMAGGGFDDSIMALTGSWSPDVEISTTVFKGSVSGIVETEHNFRIDASIGAYYEINFAWDGQYCDFIFAKGGITLSDYEYLVPSLTFGIPGGAINNGDTLISRMSGNTLTAWIDRGAGRVLIGSASDTASGGNARRTTGQPGIGAFITSGSGPLNQFCFTSFSVTEL